MSFLNRPSTNVPLLVLAPPEGVPIPPSLREPPAPTTTQFVQIQPLSEPSAAGEQFDEVFFDQFLALMDTDQNGVWSKEELRAWFALRVKVATEYQTVRSE